MKKSVLSLFLIVTNDNFYVLIIRISSKILLNHHFLLYNIYRLEDKAFLFHISLTIVTKVVLAFELFSDN